MDGSLGIGVANEARDNGEVTRHGKLTRADQRGSLKRMEVAKIYTDGSSLGNPGPGGYCAILVRKGIETIVKGRESHSTNNRMEMKAVIEALKWMQKHAGSDSIELYSDSRLVVESINKGWKRKNNLDLWEEFDRTRKGLKIRFHWIRGHAENPYNNRCDKIAVEEAEKASKSPLSSHQNASKPNTFSCQNCGATTEGRLSLMPDSGMIRTDCAKCKRFIMFASKTKPNIARAKKRLLLTKSQLEKIVQRKESMGETVSKNDLAILKTWTQNKATRFLETDQTLF